MPRRYWSWLVAGTLLVVFAANLATADRSPIVWLDEAMFADPAVNYLNGRGLTSSAWWQPADRVWTQNAPLHTWLLVPWLSVTGVSPTAVRAVNYVYVAAAALLVWVAVRRSGLVESPGRRAALVALLVMNGPIAFSYRSGRYDALGMLLAAGVFAAATIRPVPVRAAVAFGIGVLMPLTGLQLLPFAVAVSAVALVVYGRQTLTVSLPLGFGIVAGGGVLFAVFAWFGGWDDFTAAVLRLRSLHGLGPDATVRTRAASLATKMPRNVAKDTELVVSVLVLIAGLVTARGFRRPEVMALAVVLTVPLWVGLSGVFPLYYFWMIGGPALIGAVAVWDRLARSPTRLARRLATAAGVLFAVSSLGGLPLRLGISALEWSARDPERVTEFVTANVRPDDVVAADWQAFYALHRVGAETVYTYRWPLLTPEEKGRLTVLLLYPDDASWAVPSFGGKWEPVAELATAPTLNPDAAARMYRLTLYRRVRSE